MKKSILITGIAGSGKTAICRQLNKLGYKAFDIENTKGLFKMFDKNSGKSFKEHDNNNLKEVEEEAWICNIEKLKIFMKSRRSKLVFYCGMGTNIRGIFFLFDKVILLKASPKTLRARLSGRTADNYGKAKNVQDWIMAGKTHLEKKLRNKGAIIVNAEGDLAQVIARILKICDKV